MAKHNDLGDEGEDLATGFLVQQGYEILERNWRYSKGEIDIIAKDGELLIFIEVKTRSSAGLGRPEQFVSAKKIRLLSKTAAVYMAKNDYTWEIRFDVIGVLIRQSYTPQIRHYKDAFFIGL